MSGDFKEKIGYNGLEMKHFSSLATLSASLPLTHKVFCKVHPKRRAEIEDTKTVLASLA